MEFLMLPNFSVIESFDCRVFEALPLKMRIVIFAAKEVYLIGYTQGNKGLELLDKLVK